MLWLIYGYKDKKTNQIKYIGQTSNLNYRKYKHEKYDPFHKELVEYNYPLSRGIRKYGIDNYECIIIEQNIDNEQLAIERESYWINYYNTYKKGYNQTEGGKAPKYIKFDKESIKKVKQMLIDKIDFNTIQKETNISLSHISEINTGKRHRDSELKYPLNSQTCGRKICEEDIDKIINLLKNTKLSQEKIGKQFNVVQTVISKINLGKSYRRENIDYPIRKR